MQRSLMLVAAGAPVALGLGCLDGSGKAADFWYAFKHPNGWDYSAMDEDGSVSAAPVTLDKSTSHVVRTLQQLYAGHGKFSYAFWNGEMTGHKVGSPYAHAKGVMAFDGKSGFWLTHSLPDFPGDIATGNPNFGAAADNYGQSYLCINIDKAAFEEHAKLAMVNRYYVYDSGDNAKMGGAFEEWAINKKHGTDTSLATTVTSVGGQAFTSFAKSAAWNDELYEGLVAPYFKLGFNTETWQNGVGKIESWCKGSGGHQYDVKNAATVKFPGADEWKESQDHSKWAVSATGSIFCVGDINRQEGQYRRGGGTVCINSAKIAKTMRGVVTATQPCGKEARDRLQFQCSDIGAEAQHVAEGARLELEETERSVTQLNDRMQGLQHGLGLTLAELQGMQDEFGAYRSKCASNAGDEQKALDVLQQDAPKAKALVAKLTASCNFAGGTAPGLAECSLADGTYLVTLEDQALRTEVGQLSGLLERLMSLNLGRAVRAKMAAGTSLLQVAGGVHRGLRGRHAAHAGGRGGRRATAAASARASRLRRRVQHRRHRLVQRRQILAATALPADICTTAASPPCESLADYLASFLGGVDDLVDEIKVRRQVQEGECRVTLGKYDRRMQTLKEQAGRAQVEIANTVADQNTLVRTRLLRKDRARDTARETKRVTGKCVQDLRDATAAMCGATRLFRELAPDASAGPFLGECEVTDWVADECSVPCGTGGVQNISRRIIREPPKALCAALTGNRTCNERRQCPVDGLMSRWGEWSECSAGCGGGTRTRMRSVLRRPQFGGLPLGETMQEEVCASQPCDQDCVLSSWTNWTNCSKVCGEGHRERRRDAVRLAIGDGECPAEDSEERKQFSACNRDACQASPALVCKSKLDLVVAADISGSMGSDGVAALKKFVESAAQRATFGEKLARMGVVKFSGKAEMHTDLTADQSAFTSSLASIAWAPGPTNIGEALAVAGGILDSHARPQAQQAIVVVTDGVPSSAYILSSEADKLRRKGVRLVFLLVGPGGSRKAAARWASSPIQENLMSVENVKKLAEAETVTRLLANLCPSFE